MPSDYNCYPIYTICEREKTKLPISSSLNRCSCLAGVPRRAKCLAAACACLGLLLHRRMLCMASALSRHCTCDVRRASRSPGGVASALAPCSSLCAAPLPGCSADACSTMRRACPCRARATPSRRALASAAFILCSVASCACYGRGRAFALVPVGGNRSTRYAVHSPRHLARMPRHAGHASCSPAAVLIKLMTQLRGQG